MSSRESAADPEQIFGSSVFMAVLRNRSAAETVSLTHKAFEAGIELVEVPIQSPDAVPALEAAVRAAAEIGRRVGAGTVTTPEQVDLCARLGVSFTVAPGLDTEVVARSGRRGIPHLPGVATATEIQRAVALGCDWVKVFPASVLGPQWFSAMVRGPFPDVHLFASGGMTPQRANDYLSAGARGVAISSALADADELSAIAAVLAENSRAG